MTKQDGNVATTTEVDTAPETPHVPNVEPVPLASSTPAVPNDGDASPTCNSCVKNKTKIENLTKTNKTHHSEIKNLKSLISNLESVIVDHKTDYNKLQVSHETVSAELERSRQYLDMIMKNRGVEDSNTDTHHQQQQHQRLTDELHSSQLHNNSEGIVQNNQSNTPPSSPHLSPNNSTVGHLQFDPMLSHIPIEDAPLPETCPGMWYENKCDDGFCNLNHNINTARKNNGICVSEFKRINSCKTPNCKFSHDFPSIAREDPIAQDYVNKVVEKRRNFNQSQKFYNKNRRHSNSNSPIHNPPTLMSIVTELEQKGWQPMSNSGWHQSSSTPTPCGQRMSDDPGRHPGSICQPMPQAWPNAASVLHHPSPPTYNLSTPQPTFPNRLQPASACSSSAMPVTPTNLTTNSMLDFLGQLVHQMVNSALQNHQPLINNPGQ